MVRTIQCISPIDGSVYAEREPMANVRFADQVRAQSGSHTACKRAPCL